MANVKRTFARGFAFGSVTFVAGATVSLISAVVTARIYGIRVIGEYTLAYAPTATVWYFSTVQEQPSLVRRLARLQPRSGEGTALWLTVSAFSQALTTVVVAVASGLTVLAFEGPLHHKELIGPALFMMATYLLLGNPGWNIDTVFAAFRAASELFAVRFHQMLMFILPAVALRLITSSVWGLVGALAFSYGSSLIHRAILVRRFISRRVTRADFALARSQLSKVLRFGFRATPGALASGVSSMAGTWILGGFASLIVVGGWSRAVTISQRLGDMNNRTVDMLLPTLAERQGIRDMTGFDRALVDSMRYVSMILLLPAAAAGGAAAGVLTLLFGSRYDIAAGALSLLVLVPVLAGINAFCSQALFVFNRPTLTSALELGRLCITVGAGIVLTIRFGSTGMGAAVLCGSLVEAVVMLRLVSRAMSDSISILWPWRAVFAAVGALIAGFVVAHVTSHAVPGAVGTLLGVGAGGVTYIVSLLAFGGMLPRDRERLRDRVKAIQARRLGKTG